MEEDELLDEYEQYVKTHLEKRWSELIKRPFGLGLSIQNKTSYKELELEIGKFFILNNY